MQHMWIQKIILINVMLKIDHDLLDCVKIKIIHHSPKILVTLAGPIFVDAFWFKKKTIDFLLMAQTVNDVR